MFESSLGIHIENKEIVAVCLKSGMNSIRPAHTARIPLPETAKESERFPAVTEAINALVRENAIRPEHFFLGVPSSMAIVRMLTFPLAVKDNLRQAVKYEMERYLPLPADKLYYDLYVVSEDRQNQKMQVLLAAVKKSDLAPYVDMIEDLGQGVSGISLAGAGLRNTLYRLHPENLSEEPDAEAGIISGKEVQNNAIDTSSLGIPSKEYAAAYGLALAGIEKNAVSINFLPENMRKRPGKLGIYMFWVLAGMLVLSLGFLSASFFLSRQMETEQMEKELGLLKNDVREIQEMKKQFFSIRDKITYINTIRMQTPPVVEMIKELTQVIPDGAWVHNFRLKDESIQIDGEADSASDLVTMIEGSRLFENTEFLSPITRNKEEKERFRIGMKVRQKDPM